jgi:hypothetical protein
MAVSGRHVPAGHHRGDDGDAHGGVGGERAADGGAGSTRRRAASGHARGPRERASAIPGRGSLAVAVVIVAGAALFGARDCRSPSVRFMLVVCVLTGRPPGECLPPGPGEH